MHLALLLYKYFPYGGMQRDFRRFAEELLKRGHRLRVYYIDWQGEPLAGVELRQVPVGALNNHTRNERYHRWVEADLVAHPVDGTVGFNKMPGLDVYYAADSCYMDKALNERGWLYRLSPRFRHFSAYERAVFGEESETLVLLISSTEKAKFAEHYRTPEERMRMLPPGISPDRRAGLDAPRRRAAARAGLGMSDKNHVLLFVGSGFIKKGLGRALQALAKARLLHPDRHIQLFVVGQDKEQRYRRMARRLGVADAVEFLGGREDIPDLLLAADLLVHPALDEAAGIVLLEALVAGLPVLTTDVCGYAEHIQRASAGLVLASPFDQQQMDAGLVRCLDVTFLERCRESALEYAVVEDLYSMHQMGAAIIEDCLERKRPR